MITNYFNKIDSSEKAYWLGLLYADGNIYKRKDRPNTYRIQLKLAREDGYLVEQFKRAINTSIQVREEKDGTRLIFTNKEMAIDLINLGCVPKKSFIIKFPDDNIVPYKYKWDFIRGFFDGDGGVNTSGSRQWLYFRIFSASESFIDGFIDFLKRENIIINKPKRREDNVFEISIGKKEYQKIIFCNLYKNINQPFMKRKHNKIITYANTEVKQVLKDLAHRNA